ncbi:hypothetical protein HBI17_217790 [Parastagonospora nodorum]|nr:hypothetical protein HBI17_217790 [Parastagonospora nodorum]
MVKLEGGCSHSEYDNICAQNSSPVSYGKHRKIRPFHKTARRRDVKYPTPSIPFDSELYPARTCVCRRRAAVLGVVLALPHCVLTPQLPLASTSSPLTSPLNQHRLSSYEGLDPIHIDEQIPYHPHQSPVCELDALSAHVKDIITTINSLEDLGLQHLKIPLPKIIVIGEQSTGKSSVIEAISGIKTPRSTGTCTRCPLFIKLESPADPAAMWSARVTLRRAFSYDGKRGRDRRFPGWVQLPKPSIVEFMSCDNPDDLEHIIFRAQRAVTSLDDYQDFTEANIESLNGASSHRSSPNIVCISISNHGLPTLCFYDLPSVIGQSEIPDDVPFSRNLVSEYVKDPEALILVTCSMTNNIANSTAGGIARALKAADRCIGIYLPDRLLETTCHEILHNVFEKKRLPLGHGYFVVRNLGQEQLDEHLNHEDARAQERQFFDTAAPFASLRQHDSRFGTWNLQSFLSGKLAEQITKKLPIIEEEINARRHEVEQELKQYPAPVTQNAPRVIFDILTEFAQSWWGIGQRSIEFAPERWHVIQAIVGLIPRFAKELKKWRPESIEVERDEAGRFPRVRTLRSDAAKQLLLLLAKHIVEIGIVGLPTSSQTPDVQASLLRYITKSDLTASEIAAVESSRFWTESTKLPLLLVRGLIAGGILQFALSTKRWRVNYGLDTSRIQETQLAVPFRSKDCPSPRSEFSHPDVVILLSLLSHYYGGLTDDQLFDSFAHLLKSDQGNIQYDEWVATASPDLPPAFRQLSGVSIKDPHQCIVELFPLLRHSKKAIDYYLSFLGFPKAMKEFPQKLSASGWDIGAVRTHPVTGFSGTNDTLHLLPLTVKHLDLPSQSHTNALVLQYLLQAETSVELLPPRTNVNGSDADHLLSSVVQMVPEVRVILDCGASILEQDNQQVAEAWLKMLNDDKIEAVVFFNDEELSVLDRAGRIEPLQTSPFAKNLGVCLVYLDEAHTRGTDLKLPRNYRAAMTLGQGLVKDKLTQGCMRMRKLGLGQSVAFIVPEEISAKICERTGKLSNDSIEVSDVLCWSITETWQDLKRSMPLWAVQGERYERNSNSLCGVATTQAQAQSFLEDEAQALEVRYKPLTKEEDSLGTLKTWDLGNANIAKIVTRCQEFEAMGFGVATLSEEQERELAPEIEEERQVERPARLEPQDHSVHPDLQYLAQTGYLRPNPRVFKPAFHALAITSAASLFALEQFPTDLLVTADFERTVKVPNGFAGHHFISDSYQRPVQFVLSVRDIVTDAIQKLVIISPIEANCLLGFIREYARVTLHIFAPRANASFDSLDKLELYNIGHAFTPGEVSRSLTVQLNLFAGSLYLRSFEEYTELCDFLGLLRCKPVKGQQVYADGYIDPPSGHWGLRMSPVPFLRTLLMKIRREGEGVEKTHLGKILNGVRLEEADFGEDVEMSGA